MKSATRPRLDELDDPDLEVLESLPSGVERVTAPPPFEPSAFAQEVEAAGGRSTLPPVPAFEMLRDSCKIAIEDNDDALEAAHASSHVKIRTPPAKT